MTFFSISFLAASGGPGVIEDGEDLDPSVQDYTDEDYNDVFDSSNG